MEQAQISAAIERAFLYVKSALGIPADQNPDDENLGEIEPLPNTNDEDDKPYRRSYSEH